MMKGQSLLELVIGVGLITVIMGAMAVVAINTLRNTQFSKNQTQATKFAQANLELVRTIKNSNFGVCLQTDGATCSRWEDIWAVNFGTAVPGCTTGCTFNVQSDVINNVPGNCPVTGGTTPFRLKYSAVNGISGRFTYQIIIEDEANLQKRVTSRVFWNDSTTTGASGTEHSSDLVTILTRY